MESIMLFLIIMGIFFFIMFLWARYNSMRTWCEGQKRIMELEDKKFELQRQRDLIGKKEG